MVLYVKRIIAHEVGSSKFPVREFSGHTASVTALAGDGNGVFISGSEDGTVRIWTPDSLQHVFIGHSSRVSSLTLSPDKKYLLSGSKEIIIWDLHKLERKLAFSVDVQVNGMQFGRNGLTAYAVLENGILLLIDLQGEEIRQLANFDYALTDLAVHPLDDCIAVSFRGGDIVLMNLEGNKELRSLEMDGGAVGLEFSPDGRFLVGAGRKGQINVWNADWKLQTIHPAPQFPLRSLSVAPDGSFIVIAGISGELQFWDTADLSHIRTVSVLNSPINAVKALGNGRVVVAGANEGSLFLYSVEGRQMQHFPGQSCVRSLSVNNKALAIGIQAQTIQLWNMDDWDFLEGSIPDGWINSIAFSPDGSMIATGSKDNVVKIWNAQTMGLAHTFIGHRLPVKSVAFSPDGSLLASGSSDKTVRIWDVNRKAEVKVLAVPHWVQSVAFSEDGSRLAAQLVNGDVLYWDLETFESSTDANGIRFAERQAWESPEFRAVALAETVILEVTGSYQFQNPSGWVQVSEFCFSRMA